MDKRALGASGIGVEVEVDTQLHIGALRYVAPVDVQAALRDVTAGSLPEVCRAVVTATVGGTKGVLLLWRSPSETLVVSPTAEPLGALVSALAGATQACLVDQSGGYWALRVSGPKAPDLLVRLGATTSVPRLGESLVGRLADLTVQSACVLEGEVLLLVERLYTDHLLGWIEETLADF